MKDIWYSSKLRARIIHNLENNFIKQELNVAVALIMGQQQDIDPDIIRDYQYAGAYYPYRELLGFILQLLKPIGQHKIKY
jgi:hypothetical protein